MNSLTVRMYFIITLQRNMHGLEAGGKKENAVPIILKGIISCATGTQRRFVRGAANE